MPLASRQPISVSRQRKVMSVRERLVRSYIGTYYLADATKARQMQDFYRRRMQERGMTVMYATVRHFFTKGPAYIGEISKAIGRRQRLVKETLIVLRSWRLARPARFPGRNAWMWSLLWEGSDGETLRWYGQTADRRTKEVRQVERPSRGKGKGIKKAGQLSPRPAFLFGGHQWNRSEANQTTPL